MAGKPDPADRLDAVALLSLLCGGRPTVPLYICEIPGSPQPKERARTVGHRSFTPPRTVAATKIVARALAASVGGDGLGGDVALVALFYRANRVRCDVDNLLKLVLDAGNDAAIWGDDSQVKALSARMAVDKHAPRTVVAWCEMGK